MPPELTKALNSTSSADDREEWELQGTASMRTSTNRSQGARLAEVFSGCQLPRATVECINFA